MATSLIYKTSGNTVSVCVPANIADVQKTLAALGLEQFVANQRAAITLEESLGMDTTDKTNRIAWAQSVADFNNITETDFQNLINCDVPKGTQYQYWVDVSLVNFLDPLRSAWSDMDASGNITYNPSIAQTLTINALLSHVKSIKSQLNDLNEIANAGSSTTTISGSTNTAIPAIETTTITTTTTNSQITSLQSSLTSALAALNTANTASVAVSTDVINILQPLWSVITTASIATTTMPSTAATTITS